MRVTAAVLELPVRLADKGPGWREALGEWWCRLMHDDITWPVKGYYRCRRCYRRYPVPWEEPAHRKGDRLAEMPAVPSRAEVRRQLAA